MGVSSDGQLSFGIPFDEEFIFPWSGNDIGNWWREVHNYCPPSVIYDAHGNFVDDLSTDDLIVAHYYKHRRQWLEKNPLPVKLVTYCSFDYPMYLITVPTLSYSVGRGYAKKIPDHTKAEENNARDTIVDFCDSYSIAYPCEPDWYLTSLYG